MWCYQCLWVRVSVVGDHMAWVSNKDEGNIYNSNIPNAIDPTQSRLALIGTKSRVQDSKYYTVANTHETRDCIIDKTRRII
jgi:hypothetical protein